MSTRLKTLAVLTAAAVVSSAASAQTYTFTQTELGRIVPARFATTTQALMANVDLAVAPAIVPEAVATDATDSKVSIPSDDISTWNAVAAIDSDDEKKEESEETSFFGTTMGRASIVGLAGLAGASYFALRSESPVPARDQAVFDAATLTPTFTENPEPATIVLMGTGLLGLGIAARRRRSN